MVQFCINRKIYQLLQLSWDLKDCVEEQKALKMSNFSQYCFQLPDSKVSNIPVAVIASNRPHYLYRYAPKHI